MAKVQHLWEELTIAEAHHGLRELPALPRDLLIAEAQRLLLRQQLTIAPALLRDLLIAEAQRLLLPPQQLTIARVRGAAEVEEKPLPVCSTRPVSFRTRLLTVEISCIKSFLWCVCSTWN